jgi:hypothetical protein
MVKRVWERPSDTHIQRWNNKMCALRKHMSSWTRNTTGILKKEKQLLSSIIDDVEAFAEVRMLTTQKIELKNQSNADIVKLL